MAVSRKARRQTVPDGVVLSIYKVMDSPAPVITSPSSSVAGPGVTLVPSGGILTSETFLSTSASTITSCPPGATHCSVGAVTSIIVTGTSLAIVPSPTIVFSLTTTPAAMNTFASSATSAVATQATPGVAPGSTTASCVGIYCDGVYIMEPWTGALPAGEPVFVRKPCECQGGYVYVLAPCDSEPCGNMALYMPVPCTHSAPAGAPLYQPQASDTSPGGVEFVQSDSPTANGGGSGEPAPSVTTEVSVTTTPSLTEPSGTETSTIVEAGAQSLVACLIPKALLIYTLLVHLV